MGKNKNKRKLEEMSNSHEKFTGHAVTTMTSADNTSQDVQVHKKSFIKPVSQLDTNQKQSHKVNANEWNFAVDYNDHFETPKIAYSDLAPVLQALTTNLGKSIDQLIIYDPYWCKGNMVSRMAELGFTTVMNKNRDFYKDIKNNQVPDYDILVTNPPYSGEHKTKLLEFLSSRAHKPFALLLPAYTATKSYWKDFVAKTHSVKPIKIDSGRNKKAAGATNDSVVVAPSSSSVVVPTTPSPPTPTSLPTSVRVTPFYLMPPDYYEYCHPEGTGKALPPFYSSWLVGGFDPANTSRIIATLRTNPRRAVTAGAAGGAALKKLPIQVLTVLENVDAMVRMGFVTDKRPNPKARAKNKLKMSGGAGK